MTVPASPADCPFCRASIAEVAFAESEHFRVVVNRSPILPGHSLVIPKRHTPSVLELSEEELVDFTRFSKKVTEGLLRVYGGNAFNWSIQERPAAGQTVAHLHLHIVPRQEHDLPEPGDWYPLMMRTYEKRIEDKDRPWLDFEAQKELARQLREQLKAY